MTKKIFILAVLTLFSVTMLGAKSEKYIVDYQKYPAYLNYQEFFEDFSVNNGEWTEYDPINKIELDYTYDQRLEFNHWIRYQTGYVYREYPVQEAVLEYDINITQHGGNGKRFGVGFSDTLGTLNETQNGIFGVFYAGWPGGGGVPHLDLRIYENGINILDWTLFLDFKISTNKTYYVRIEKFGDQVTISIFSDADRTNHISGSPKTFTTTLIDTTFNYFYAVNANVTNPQGNWEWTTGWIDNIYVKTKQQAVYCLIDIKPQSCPNPVNVKSKGVLPIAVLGTGDFDVTTIDPASIRLKGIAPLRSKVEDVSTPVWNPQYECDCTTEDEDGFDDLILKFNTREIVEELGEVTDGEILELTLTGKLTDGTPIEGNDCIIVINKGKSK
ncbi:MAG: hypothetical protein PVH61_08380 [Candidatus Aminicenantes bacterium]|jgi:hypothetical protein